MRSPISPKLRLFLRETGAVSAIEFAIWAPLMCLLLFGGVDITRYVIATGRISDVASTIGQMASVNTSGSVNYVDLQFYHDSAMVIYPQVLTDAKTQNVTWSNDMAITMSSVTFTAAPAGCTSGCTYVPKVVWSAGSNRRSCLVPLKSSSDTSAPSATTLPADVFGSTSLLVVDVAYTFKPMLGTHFINNISILRSFYIAPRYVLAVGYQTISGDNGIATVCV